jgi:hypothetical protein
MTMQYGENGGTGDLTGTIELVINLEGSKSEHVGPVLKSDDGNTYRLFVIGDNPFQNSSLEQFIGKRVNLSGVWRNGVVRVVLEDVEVILSEHSTTTSVRHEEDAVNISEHGLFLGSDVLEVLRLEINATLYRVSHDPELCEARIGPFGVSKGIELSNKASQKVRSALMGKETWVWEWVSRHMSVPQYLFVVRGLGGEAVVTLDIAGKKLGFIKNGTVSTRDFVTSSLGVKSILAVVADCYPSPKGET